VRPEGPPIHVSQFGTLSPLTLYWDRHLIPCLQEHTLPLITFYKGWETYQHSLVETIAPLSSEQLALPAASHHWTIGMVAQHMVANRVWWFQWWMGEGSPELAPIMHWGPGEGVEPSALEEASLVAGPESTWGLITQALASWTPADLGHVFSPPASLSETYLGNGCGSGLSGTCSNMRSTMDASCL
jgi:hypothetical protein